MNLSVLKLKIASNEKKRKKRFKFTKLKFGERRLSQSAAFAKAK